MSGGSTSFTYTAVHGSKLEPPRSLHGVEDAEVIWDTITRRFPNAAPLLCEMETVIERAEDLLQQLRTPCTQGNDTSSSFHTPDSRESNATISMVSDIESFAEETNISTEHYDATENVETQFMARDIHEKQADFESQHCSEQSIRCEKKHSCHEYHLCSPSRVDGIVQHLKTSSINKCHNSEGKSDTDVKDNADKAIGVSSEERLMKAIADTNSLEGWTKITANALCDSHDDTEDDNDTETRPNVDRNIDNHLLTVNNGDKCDKTDDRKVIKNSQMLQRGSFGTEEDGVARYSAATANRRSPLTILEKYADRCKVSIKYEYKPKPNPQKPNVISGNLCGFHANSCAATEDLAKKELAANMLWMIAEHQMDDSKTPLSTLGLLDLSKEEMLEITAFNEDKLKNGSQKLYKLCLEKGESLPKYTTRRSTTHQGIMYTAQCSALGHVGVGKKFGAESAKIAAAENLYQKYFETGQQST